MLCGAVPRSSVGGQGFVKTLHSKGFSAHQYVRSTLVDKEAFWAKIAREKL